MNVWRVKARLKHKPSHLPSRCPPPPKRPRLLLNQLFSLRPLSVCQNEPNAFLFRPAAKQPGGLRVLQRIAVLIKTLGFCGVSWFCCSVIVHIGVLANFALMRFLTKSLLIVPSAASFDIKRSKHWQIYLDGECNNTVRKHHVHWTWDWISSLGKRMFQLFSKYGATSILLTCNHWASCSNWNYSTIWASVFLNESSSTEPL